MVKLGATTSWSTDDRPPLVVGAAACARAVLTEPRDAPVGRSERHSAARSPDTASVRRRQADALCNPGGPRVGISARVADALDETPTPTSSSASFSSARKQKPYSGDPSAGAGRPPRFVRFLQPQAADPSQRTDRRAPRHRGAPIAFAQAHAYARPGSLTAARPVHLAAAIAHIQARGAWATTASALAATPASLCLCHGCDSRADRGP
jgi:hypothetical protein